jgi:ankyrin repeat protein
MTNTTDLESSKERIQTAEERLLYAALEGNLEKVIALIQTENADPTCSDEEGRTSLFFAAANGHLSVVQYLMKVCNGDPMSFMGGSHVTLG